MKAELIPAVMAVTGGSALLGGIYLHEHRQLEAMRSDRIRLGLRFPIAVDQGALEAALGQLVGLGRECELVAETIATDRGVRFCLLVPRPREAAVRAALTGAIPSLTITSDAEVPDGAATLGVKLFVPKSCVLRTDGVAAASRSLLSGVSGLYSGESVVVRWALRPGRPRPIGQLKDQSPERRALERAWRTKNARPGFTVAGLILIRAAGLARARKLAGHITASYRARQMVGPSLRATFERAGRPMTSPGRTTPTSGWLNVAELSALVAWPLGEVAIPGVEVGAARSLAAGPSVSRWGRPLLIGRDARGERPVRLSPEAARHNVAITGASGSGKSHLVAGMVLSDIRAGFGGAVVDPKADLVETILERVPPEHAERVVVIDPARPGPVPGIGLFAPGGDPDLRADTVVGALSKVFASVWGVRSDYYAHLGLRTLAAVPGATIADLGRLFLEPGFRQAALNRLDDPVLVASWASYEALTAPEQAQHVQAPMARVMSLVNRPAVRAVLAQPEPKLDVSRLLRERKWLLVSLAPGTVGEPAARILGSLVMYAIWSAIEARASLPPSKRHPVFLYVDELATLAGGTPFGFELLAERARGLGAGLTVALQSLGRLPDQTRSALLANVATLIAFRAGADEASRLARELPGLSAQDLQALGRFEVAARVGTGVGASTETVTGRTEPLGPPTGQAGRIRSLSGERYGVSRETVDAALAQRASGETESITGTGGRTRRRS
jgi:hypothetical protein